MALTGVLPGVEGGVYTYLVGGGMSVITGLHYISTTWFGMLHYMAGNDYRVGKRQVSLVVDEALWWAVKGVAAVQGVSVTRLVTGLLEDAVMEPLVEPQQNPTGYRNVPDWATALPLERVRSEVVVVEGDPLEEIA